MVIVLAKIEVHLKKTIPLSKYSLKLNSTYKAMTSKHYHINIPFCECVLNGWSVKLLLF